MIKLKSILREAGLLKEQGDQSYEPVNFNFESGQHQLPPEEQQNIDRVISQVKDLVNQNYKIVDITIESSESQVPNNSPFEEPGSLAEARAKAVKDELAKRLPEYVNQINTVLKIGPTEYDKDKGDNPGDDKYKREQYVRAVIKTDPPAASGPSRYLVVQPRPGSNSKYYNIVIPSDGYPNAVDYMSPEVAQRFITTHPHRTKIDKSTLLDFLRENGNGRVRVNLVAYPLYTVIVTNYDKELPSQSSKLHDWVLSNKLHQKPGANLFE
jgi:hypothetical protein